MPTDTDLELTKTSCFKADLARIRALGERLEVLEKAGFSSQHTVSRALDVLEREVTALEQAQA